MHVTWWVNATGALDRTKIYYKFSFHEQTQNLKVLIYSAYTFNTSGHAMNYYQYRVRRIWYFLKLHAQLL